MAAAFLCQNSRQTAVKNISTQILFPVKDVQTTAAGSHTIGFERRYAAVDDFLTTGIPRENIQEVDSDALDQIKQSPNTVSFQILVSGLE